MGNFPRQEGGKRIWRGGCGEAFRKGRGKCRERFLDPYTGFLEVMPRNESTDVFFSGTWRKRNYAYFSLLDRVVFPIR